MKKTFNLLDGLGIHLIKDVNSYSGKRIEFENRPTDLTHKWDLVGFFNAIPMHESVKRDGKDIPEACKWAIEYSLDDRMSHLILTCYCNIEGMFEQLGYDKEHITLENGFVNCNSFPKYEIRHDSESGTAKLYREGELLEEVEWFEIFYNGGTTPFITMSLVGEISFHGI